MNPLVLAVVAGLAAALIWKRYGHKLIGGAGPMNSKLQATIIIGGTASNPTVHVCPDPLAAAWGERVRWDIQDPGNTGAEVWLTGFKPKGSSNKNNPFVGPDQERKNRQNPRQIQDQVKRGSPKGLYDYEIWLNGKLAADPDILIKEVP